MDVGDLFLKIFGLLESNFRTLPLKSAHKQNS